MTVAGWLGALWSLLVLSLTLGPGFGTGTPAAGASLADVVRNMLLFAPAGVLVVLSGRPVIAAALFAVLFSTAIEIAQLFIPGRFPGVRDVVMNTLGATIGAGFAVATIGPTFRSPARSARLALALGALGAGALLLPGILLKPAPSARSYHQAWTPVHPRYVPFSGRVLAASIGGVPIGESGPARSAALREKLLDGSAIEIRALRERTRDGVAPLVRLNDGRFEVLLVGVEGDDLVVRRHSLGAELGFEEPLFRSEGALARVEMGQPFELELVPRGLSWQVRVEDAAPQRFGPTPAAIWRLIADSDSFSESLRRGLDALVLALVFGTLAIWFRLRALAILGLSLVVGALFLGPGLSGLAASPPGEWLGVAVGLVGGSLLQVWLRRTSGAGPLIR